MIKYKKILTNFKAVSIYVWILLAIIVIGIFLRTYRFHDWLEFRNDQERDASIVSQVVTDGARWPLRGPYMSYSGYGDHVETNSFHLGPIYYYFQIISAKIFGNYPDKLAYPDVFFAILSIPLFFFFLKIYFKKNLSLGITGLYAISAYFIQYSRLAWNTNLIPFFVLLFLLSLYKFLEKNEKTHWVWVILLGIALGIGFQLHAIVMILFSITAFFVFLFSMKKNYKAWKKWAVVFLIFIALNSSQIVSEIKTNFNNTKSFFNFPLDRNVGGASILDLVKNDTSCHIKANFLFLSSYGYDGGAEKCSSYFSNISPRSQRKYFLKDVGNLIGLLVSIVFSIVGYFLLGYYNKNEKEKTKKYFLHLIVLYLVVGYFIMFPLSGDRMSYVEYFRFGFFMPFVFLGFFIKLISEKFAKIYIIPATVIFLLLIFSNAKAISSEASYLLDKNRTCSLKTTTLGEIEPVAEYMISSANSQKIIYFKVETKTLPAFINPLEYLLERQNINFYNIAVDEDNSQKIGESTFMLGCKRKKNYPYPYEKINSVYIYQIDK